MRFGDIYVQKTHAFMNAKCIKRIAILSLSFLSSIGGSIIVLFNRHDTLFYNAEGVFLDICTHGLSLILFINDPLTKIYYFVFMIPANHGPFS